MSQESGDSKPDDSGNLSTKDPIVSLCPECLEDDVEVANGRSGTWYCPNCDRTMGWTRVVRVRRSEVSEVREHAQ